MSIDRTAKLWNPDGTLVRTLRGDSAILGVACSANGQIIATGGMDRFEDQPARPSGQRLQLGNRFLHALQGSRMRHDGVLPLGRGPAVLFR